VIEPADSESIRRAAELLKAGGMVAIPTETVYGLAADASNPEAVARIFTTKGRPADHPLIVHIESAVQLDDWATDVPNGARQLADAFWPGPLTLILKRRDSVLDAVTGGMDTVAIRVPSHPVTQEILSAFGGGLAAPSANRFGRVSPTTAENVESDLGSDVDLIIDGGPCDIGLESTIVAWVQGQQTVLRPGAISADAIARVLGCDVTTSTGATVRAPGMLDSHYAPSTMLELCSADSIQQRAAALAADGLQVGVLSLEPVAVIGAKVAWHSHGDIDLCARSLYGHLRQADNEGLDVLLVSLPPETGLGVAVADRLRRAAHRGGPKARRQADQ